MKKLSPLQEKDLKYIFHPCSQMKDYETLAPMVIKEGKGIYLTDEFGNIYMDCVSSWWVNLFGHSNSRINEALITQVKKLEHVIFVNFTHEPAIELGERLISVAPKGLEKLIFAENGASSVEIALKISFQYHQQKGNPNKKRFISLINAYHGETLGALGVTDIDLFTSIYKPLIHESIKEEEFVSPLDLLKYLKYTGVTGVESSSFSKVKTFSSKKLTYKVAYFSCENLIS